jgi:hypothetical protein
MPAPRVIRPKQEFFESDIFEQLQSYLADHWTRAEQARFQQVDEKYDKWRTQYEAIPAQKMRSLPWPGASNFVVPISRMFIDTFVARTLNIVFATRPLYTLDFLPTEVKDHTEKYLNRKALYDWKHYELCRKLLYRGAKNGTVVVKTPYVVEEEIDITPGASESGEDYTESTVVTFEGPQSTPIPFEDFFLYPITCNELEDAEIKFHRIRFVEEEAKRRLYKWRETNSRIDVDELLKQCKMPTDIKRSQEQADAGVTDNLLRELQLVEAHLRYPLTNDPTKYFQVICMLEPTTRKLVDVYYNPYVRNLRIFQDYRPAPKEDFFFGESWCQILEQAQEEASVIHNDRRNNSYIANSPVFKRRKGSLLPNPSTNWYPGKVWDLEDMADFEVVQIGRNYNDMLAEENHILMLAERLVGIGAVQQGNASGMMGKRGIYNAAGTLAVLSESNQRQDTNIRDIRQVLGAIGKLSFLLQREYGSNDPIIDMFPPSVASKIREGIGLATPTVLAHNYFKIEASNAGANAEAEKASLMQMAQVVGQYGQSVPQMAQMLMTMENPIMRGLLLQTARMHKWMAAKLIRSMGEMDSDGLLPDIVGAFSQGAQGQPIEGGPAGPPQLSDGGGAGPADGAGLAAMLAGVAETPLPDA